MRRRRAPLARRVRPRPVPAEPTVGYGIEVYAVGVCHASVCYPRNLQLTYVTDALDVEYPTGLDHGWQPSDAKTFRTGLAGLSEAQENPCRCDRDPSRVHRLFVC